MSEVISRSERSIIFKEQLPADEWIIWKLPGASKNTLTELENEFVITGRLKIDGIRKPFKKGFYENKESFSYYYFEGDALKTYIHNNSSSIKTFLEISLNIVSVIKKLHEAGILHLRLNSNNILINSSCNKICLIDFSLASPRNNAKPVQFNDWGSELAYISPEQTGHLKQAVDERSDLYSFGVVLYEMLAEKTPFTSTDNAALVHDHLIKIPQPLKEIQQEVPAAISSIVGKLLVKKPENRYQTAEGLEYDLRRCYQLLREGQTIDNFQPGLHDEQPLKLTEKLIGREQAIASLRNELDKVMQGDNRLCLVSGEQGSGKTALVELFIKNIRNKNGIAISGCCVETSVNLPYNAIVDALKNLAAFILSQGEKSPLLWKSIVMRAAGKNKSFLVKFIPEYKWIIGESDEADKPESIKAISRTDFSSLFLNILKEAATVFDFIVLFIDDLQWSDADSWKCIRAALSDKEIKKFLFIGTYRSTYKEKLSNFRQNIAHLIQLKKDAPNIELHNLELHNIEALIAASVISGVTEPLSRLLFSRTLGNPFFLRQFLQTLYKNKILRYNKRTQNWVLDSDKAEEVQITDNVINYISYKLKDLPAEARDVLSSASCIGNIFNVETLKNIIGKAKHSIEDLLTFLEEEGFIEKKENHNFSFVHDRIRKAAYEMLPEEQRAFIHYKAAAFLHSKADIISPEKIFIIASHYNLGYKYIPEHSFFTVAELNMSAGLQAKQSAAFELSYEYFKAALSLLRHIDWKNRYEAVLNMYNEATEVAMVAGAYSDAEAWLKESLENAINIQDRIKAHEIKLNHLTETHKFPETVNYLLQVLDEIGYGIKRHPGKFAILKEFALVKWFLRNKELKDILNLKPISNERAKAFIKLTVNAQSSIFGTAPDILPIVIFRQVRLSLKYGNSIYSPYAYASYGFAISTFMNDLKRGYQFGQLALQLVDKLNAEIIKAKVMVIFYNFLSYSIDSLRKSIAPLKEAYFIGRKTGDLLYAAFALAFHSTVRLHCSENLSEIFLSLEEDCNIIKEMNQDLVFRITMNQLQLVYNLSHHVADPLTLQYNSFDETAYLDQLIQAKDNATIFDFYFSKLFLACTFNKMQQAFEYYEKARKYEDETTARQIIYPAFLMYSAMAEMKNSINNPANRFDEKKVKTKIKTLERFARFAPVNYNGKLYFLYALAAEHTGDFSKAEEHFLQAIQYSQNSAFIAEEALAREHLAFLSLKTGKKEYAEMMLQKAYTCYQRWGAISKCDQLKESFQELFSLTETPEMNIASFQNIYNLNTIINANKALSSENSLEGLLKRLLEIVIQNASADKAIVILKKGQHQIAKAIGSNEGITILSNTAANETNVFPMALANFAERTASAYSSDNLAADKRFSYDAYIAQQNPVSACCIPIYTKTAYLGAIYLENNFAEAVFDDGKVEFFKTIASQLAISLENVSLLAEMEQKVKERTAQLTMSLQELKAAQAQLVQQEKMAYLGELTAGIAHEIQNPLNFVNNFSEVSNELISEMVDEANKGNTEEVKTIANDLKDNLKKINHHGKRADAIVKGMLQHSRQTSGAKEPTDINKLADEYLRLSYHGLRAKDKSFNADFKADFDETIGKINIVPQDIGRVLLNLFNNAFYAAPLPPEGGFKNPLYKHQPTVWVSTKKTGDYVLISIRDNGPGIPQNIIDKIFQPFFTTKPTGQGTGLGLSLAYDIITKEHNGTIKVESKEGEGSVFIINLPVI